MPLEQFYWALLAALACFVSEMLIGNRRRSPRGESRAGSGEGSRAPGLRPAAAALALLAGVASTHAATPQSAEQAYQKGDFAKAQQEYAATAAKQPAEARAPVQRRLRRLQSGRLCASRDRFQQSLKTGQVPVQDERLLQPRQHAIPPRPEDRESESAGDDQDLGGSREVL